MHFHKQLVNGKRNVSMMPMVLSASQEALYFIAACSPTSGIISVYNPTPIPIDVGSRYEARSNVSFPRAIARLHPGTKYDTQPNKVRLEYRPPDGTCNPYWPCQICTPVWTLSPTRSTPLRRLWTQNRGYLHVDTRTPRDEQKPSHLLQEAASALQEDHHFLQAGDVFDEMMIADCIH
jgi:glutamine synthetase